MTPEEYEQIDLELSAYRPPQPMLCRVVLLLLILAVSTILVLVVKMNPL